MLFFRSEERIDEWCAAHGRTRRPSVTLPQLWQLATTWYGTRLELDARRPRVDEMTTIFANIGLTGAFSDPSADSFK